MAFSNLLNHKCDVYHNVKTSTSPGYNLPGSPKFSYPDTPDITEVPCHFEIRVGTQSISQKEPQADFDANIKLVYLNGTDIRINDKIVDIEDGFEYTAGKPRKVRNHHMFVMLTRTDEQKPIGVVKNG